MQQKQNCGDEDIPPPSFGGGPMYDEATARKMLEEAELIPIGIAHGSEAVIGFDPDDEALDNRYVVWAYTTGFHGAEVTPMIYFAREGDLKMCRYLVSRGASATKASSCGRWFPMFAAVIGRHFDVCKFLYANGAKSDIRRESFEYYRWTPLTYAAAHENDAFVRWLVLEGALCDNASSETIEKLRTAGTLLSPRRRRRKD